MAPRRRDDVQAGLLRKGFRLSTKDHWKLIYYDMSGRKTSVWTKVSYGSSHRDISDQNLGNMARQCHLSRLDFDDLIDCPLSREQYERKLVAGGYIS